MSKTIRASVPAFLWAVFIFATSCTVIGSRAFVGFVATKTSIRMSATTFRSFWADWWWVFIKGYHVLEYAILTWLLLRAFRPWAAFFIAVLYASSDEFHQTFVPGRGGHVRDVLIDSGGVLLALLVAAIWSRRGHPKYKRA